MYYHSTSCFGIKGITSYYDLVMHHWSSRKHYILDYLIIVGRQNIKTWPFSVLKSPKRHFSWYLEWILSDFFINQTWNIKIDLLLTWDEINTHQYMKNSRNRSRRNENEWKWTKNERKMNKLVETLSAAVAAAASQYLMWPPFALITAAMRLGTLTTSFSRNFGSNDSQIRFTFSNCSSMFFAFSYLF